VLIVFADCSLLSGEKLRSAPILLARDLLVMDVLVEVHNRQELDLALEYTQD